MAHRGRRLAAPYRSGGNDGLSQAVGFAAGPLSFGLVGWLIDGLLGTAPVFLVLLACLGVIGSFVTFYFRYHAEVEQAEEGKPWTRRHL